MSDLRFRIVVAHDPHSERWPYDATVFDAGGMALAVLHGETPEQADGLAREWVRAEASRREYKADTWVDGLGRDAAAPEPEGAET